MTHHAAALRYARALFDVGLKEADPAEVGRALDEFAALVAGHVGLQRALANPAVPSPQKRAVVAAVLEKVAVPTMVGKLLLLLAERDRLALLPELAAAYQERLLDHQQVVRAEVTSAVLLPEDRLRELKASLAAVTGRDVRLEARVDPAILGGVVARVGSVVYDGSVARQLERMKDKLAHGYAF
jgi:F-type H+-transporting ATPase subunit delta